MKVAFDENVPPHIVRLIKAVADDGRHPGIEVVSARDFARKGDVDDVPWIQRFQENGGSIIVSGDKRMRSRLHERKALIDAGMIVFFFVPAWCDQNFYIKCAMLLVWWQEIIKRAQSAEPVPVLGNSVLLDDTRNARGDRPIGDTGSPKEADSKGPCGATTKPVPVPLEGSSHQAELQLRNTPEAPLPETSDPKG